MPIDQSPLDYQQWGSNSARLGNFKPTYGYHSHGVPLPPDTGLTIGLTRPFKVGDRSSTHPPPLSFHPSQSLSESLFRARMACPQVTSIPPNMRVGGKGPLLSAYKYDREMLWARVSQIHQLSLEVRD
jgi:hypothetical protein